MFHPFLRDLVCTDGNDFLEYRFSPFFIVFCIRSLFISLGDMVLLWGKKKLILFLLIICNDTLFFFFFNKFPYIAKNRKKERKFMHAVCDVT